MSREVLGRRRPGGGAVLIDGAMGTELLRRGAHPEGCLEALNLLPASPVSTIHREYRAAGAEVLTTNSFGANRFRLARHGMEHRVGEINGAAVALAREQADGALVAGCVGPSGIQASPPERAALLAAFREQAEALERGGVDLFSCETYGDVGELRAAVEAIRSVSSRPILAQLTYLADGHTPLGLSPTEVARELADLPIAALAALGVNCAVGHGTVVHVIHELRQATTLPLIAQPNAGEPVLRDGSWQYPLDPAAFLALTREILADVSFIGGCCGTTPEHIRALAQAMSG